MNRLTPIKAFIDAIPLDGLHINYENENYPDADIEVPYARFKLGGSTTTRESVGACGTDLIECESTLEILIPAPDTNVGIDMALDYEDIIAAAANSYTGILSFINPVYSDVGYTEDSTWYVLPINIPYQFTKRRLN